MSCVVYRRSGFTIGHLLSKVGIRTVDVGAAILSMHSIRETGGSHDVKHVIDLFSSFFEGFGEFSHILDVD
jgi:aspartyl aminopeptidase